MKNFPPQYNLQPEDALYFCHIPKTAGMTFRTIVEDYFDCNEICPATLNAQIDEIPQAELEKYRLFRGHLVFVNLPELLPNRNFVNVTVLRDPIARVISHYDYIRRTPGDPHYEAVSNMTIEEFSQKLTVGKVGKNIQTYYVAKTQRFHLEKLSGQDVLEIAKESIDRFAFVGLLERFQDSLFLLSHIFGWRPILNSRKENASAAKKSYANLPASTLDRLRESSQLDIELYEYAQAIFNQRYGEMCQTLLNKYGDATASSASGCSASIASDLTRELLEKHYAERYAQLQLPAQSCMNYSFCEPLRGSGWQRRECPESGVAYRWTGPGTISSLDLPLTRDTDLIVEFRVISTWATVPEVLDSLTFKVNGHPIPLTVLYPDQGARLFQGTIPRSILVSDLPFTRLTFEVCRVTPLNTLNPRSADTRPVGLAFHFLQVFPTALESEKSAALVLFDRTYWTSTAEFVQRHLQPGERTVVPLPAFKIKLSGEVYDYETAITKNIDFQWAMLHKGMLEQAIPTLLKLVSSGFAPVLANEVFVVFTTRKDLPRLSYLSPHVKSLYVEPIKHDWTRRLKSFYVKYLGRKAAS